MQTYVQERSKYNSLEGNETGCAHAITMSQSLEEFLAKEFKARKPINTTGDRQCQVRCQGKGHYFISSTDLRDGQASSILYQAAKDKNYKKGSHQNSVKWYHSDSDFNHIWYQFLQLS